MNRELLRQKLREKINNKKSNRNQPNLKQLKKTKEEYNNLLKDQRVTPEMLNLYTNAFRKYTNNKIPKPNEILDNCEKYKDEYGKYILNIIKNAKEEKLGIAEIKLLLNNEYSEYLTHMLGIPKLPDFLNKL
jgi:hypothetical protein